ncbi:hypothetical protein [Streptomyces sp. NPDC059168]|uniref:hypothetical protein n=1 Tax=Streptomyces sp. NPDC059168 TaxID=3346753 RepID=UPI0036AE31F0
MSQTLYDIDPRPAPHRPVRTVGDTTVVELRAEIDIFTAPPLAARLDALTADPHPDLGLDVLHPSLTAPVLAPAAVAAPVAAG